MSIIRRLAQLLLLIGFVGAYTGAPVVAAPRSPQVTCEDLYFTFGSSWECDCSYEGCWECWEFYLGPPSCPSDDCTKNDFCAEAEHLCDNVCASYFHVFHWGGCAYGESNCDFVCGCAPPF